MNISRTTDQFPLSLFRVAQDKQSYTNMLYLLISFPLGLFYFVFLFTGIIVGIGTLIIWIGVLILILMMAAWWHIAIFERHMAINWLHVAIPPLSLSYAAPTDIKRWQKIQAHLSRQMTWKTLAYLLLKFPLGLFSFIITLILPVLSIVVTIVSLILWLVTAPFTLLIMVILDTSNAGERLRQYFLFALAGFGLSLTTLHLLNGLAFISGQFARLMLGMSDAALRLEQARATAAQERARAEQAEQRRHDLVINVSHELRTPVASISGHLESLLLATENGTTTPPPATLYNYLNIAHNEAGRLGKLVDELLSLARMESHELLMNMQPIVASETIEEVYQTLMPLAKNQRQVTLVRGTAPNLPPVLADQQRLVQILLNLVRNAIVSTPAGGIVSMHLELADPQHLAFTVADNGVGIPEKDLEHIFERFYRGDTARSHTAHGFGLGLAIVHELVTAMGGSISVESTEGIGSNFRMVLRTATSTHPHTSSTNPLRMIE